MGLDTWTWKSIQWTERKDCKRQGSWCTPTQGWDPVSHRFKQSRGRSLSLPVAVHFPWKTTDFQDHTTQGVNKDGTLKHNYSEEDWRLVPLGFYNWKLNGERSRYGTYEQELLSGILNLASQVRSLGHLPIVWLSDEQATSTFMKNPLHADQG